MKKILALDLSLTGTGYCLPNGETGKLEPPKAVGLGCERLDWILARILGLASSCGGAEVVVIEGYAFGRENAREKMGELGGLIRWALWKRKMPFAIVPPSSLKQYATGKGNAPKPLMHAEAMKRLQYLGHDPDEVDALWLWAMGMDAYGFPPALMPQVNREAIGKVHWPGLPPPPPKARKKKRPKG